MKFSIKNLICQSVFLFLFCGCNNAILAQNRVPQFKDYPVKTIFLGKNAPLLLTKDSRTFRTGLKEALNDKPNFAGHYIITTWGCGTGCQVGPVIDAKTGKVYYLPFPVGQDYQADDDFKPAEFRLDSKLITFSGFRVDKNEEAEARFYKFENGRFKFLKLLRSSKLTGSLSSSCSELITDKQNSQATNAAGYESLAYPRNR